MGAFVGILLGILQMSLSIANKMTDGKNKLILLEHREIDELTKKVSLAQIIFDGRADTKIFGNNAFSGTDVLISSGHEEYERYIKLRNAYNEL